MDLADIRNELNQMEEQLDNFRGSLDFTSYRDRIAELENQMTDPSFWDDPSAAQKVISETNGLKELVQGYDHLVESVENLEVSYELVKEEQDEELFEDLKEQVQKTRQAIDQFELNILLSEQYDQNNAIIEIHPGAGGTESQDWAEMLLRMYTRYAERKGFKVDTLDYLPGDEAGVKSVTLQINGHNAYGYLKAEKGVHRLVRISPFDSSGRRHTSFASLDVMPEFNDEVEIEINQDDLKTDTYRASGAGGQHVNTTDSAVRITHLPTNIIVTSQAERSQIKNREQAMKMLKSKLYQREIERQQQEIDDIRGELKEIGWGSQIRSYVFHPYNMVKDHRTNVEIGNTEAVMNGNLDPFINAYLRSKIDG
ncbi:peptide chain release factor 2 [Alkalibacillus sp. S2W]|uniref:peptide chain release factor 2 n=1 Tax=Alkalibacillus sp. S2W TaxID=3386553 RepID=UPI00398CBFC9